MTRYIVPGPPRQVIPVIVRWGSGPASDTRSDSPPVPASPDMRVNLTSMFGTARPAKSVKCRSSIPCGMVESDSLAREFQILGFLFAFPDRDLDRRSGD